MSTRAGVDRTDIESSILCFVRELLRDRELDVHAQIFAVASSVVAVELVIFVEVTFDLRIESEDLDIANFASVEALSSLVLRKLAVTRKLDVDG